MATTSDGCSPGSDRMFGPRVDPNCRSFDFTLQFEDIFFACLPVAIFLALLPGRVAALLLPRLRRNSPTSSPISFPLRSKLLGAKLTALTALLAAQLAFLALRFQHPAFATNASLAADILSAIATVAALILSFADHTRALRPSTLLGLYLSVLVVLGIPRTRTFWLLLPHSSTNGDRPVPALATLVFALTSVALILESVEKKIDIAIASNPNQPRSYGKGTDDQDSTVKGRVLAPEQKSGIWTRTGFTWLAATFRAGYTRIIALNDLPPLDTGLKSQQLGKTLATTWTRHNPQAKHSLLRACFQGYLFSLLSAVIPRLFLTAFTFAQPFLVNTTVTFVGQENPDSNYGKGLIGAWALVYLGVAVSTSIYQYQNFRFITRMRGGLIALIYDKTLHRRAADKGEITAMALMSTDVERIVNGMQLFHETWGSLVDIAIASWLLGLQMSVACLAPIVLIIVFIAATSKVSIGARTAQVQWVEKVQERLKVTSNFLSNMKAVKMLGLSSIMSSTIQKLRMDEVNTSKAFRKLLVWTLLLSLTPINLAPVVTFAVYVIIALFWKNESLLAAQAFTSITLISLLTTPVVIFIQALPQVFQCIGSFERIQEYCSYNGVNPDTDDHDSVNSQSNSTLQHITSLGSSEKDAHIVEKPLISLRGQSFAWAKDKPVVLKDLTVDIQVGEVTAIVGPVGSGKSAFLNSLVGEMITIASASGDKPQEKGGIRGAMAYCAQAPWLENKTVRQNIIGISAYEKTWYDSVTYACGLDPDLRQLPRRDQTSVGSTGQNLSGGQKQRIALARAVYSRHKITILDDVFSGMDSNTANLVASRLLGRDGLLRKSQTTVVLATHNKNIMALADSMIVFKDGSIIETGSPAELLEGDGYVSKLRISVQSESDTEHAEGTSKANNPELTRETSRLSTQMAEETDKSLTDLRRKHGDFAVYKYYITNAGYLAVGLYAGFVTLWMFCTEFSTVVVNWWSEANAIEPNKDVGLYMGIYAMLGVLGVIGACIAAWFAIISIVSNTAANLHADLLKAVVSAPFRILASTDSGELLNRFSQDMELVDMELPLVMVNYTSTAVSIVIKVVILAIFSKYLGITIPFLALAIYFLQRFYLQTSRQVRLLGIEARAPLYTHFGETTDTAEGSTTIRAFGWQSHYRHRNYELVDDSQRPVYLQSCIQHWLAFVLDVLVAALAVVLVAVVVTWHDRFSAGSVGVSLLIVVRFSETLARLIQNWTKLESSVGAVARVKRFVADTEVEEEEKQDAGVATDSRLPPNWPGSGAVQFVDVTASYGPSVEPALKNISLSIQPGQHVAICGRTGSGKTSLLLALLRMLDEPSFQGQIQIDGVDIATINRADLRACINVIPQDPFFVPGTLRFNMDPFPSSSTSVSNSASTLTNTSNKEQDIDEMIRRALQRVGLWDSVSTQDGLDVMLDPTSWSAGQRQLLCLARAMVRQWKRGSKGGILVLDEAMSSVDAETESVMQEIIDSEFKDCTVVAIMHRLSHVLRSYDVVALLDSGELLEYEAPATLIEGDTRFKELYRLNGDN
ncbi:ABC transporter [Annulohypoxylon moriforme]|nr:ABC transporter [Annulohypoxylon moriforme]